MRLLQTILNILRFNRRNWRAVILCVFAATIFWFFNALNKTYTTNISFPLRFDYDKTSYVPVGALPQQVRLNVTGNGWDLFKQSTGVRKAPLEVPLNRPADVKKIVGSTLPVIFSNQVKGLEINFVLTDTLYLDLELKMGRWIKLAMDSVHKNIRPGYGIASKVRIVPDSIYIEGPQRQIIQFQEPVQLKLRQRDIDEDFKEEVGIEITSSDIIKREPSTVAVAFDVEKMVTIQDSILIAVENVPPTVSFIETRNIPVTVAVPENQVDELNLDSTKAVLDLRNFTRGEAKILPRVENLPPFTKLVKIDTVRIRL